MKRRCAWAVNGGPLDRKYHDREWGVPVHSDRKLFEFLILEGAQAGLSWSTILRKRKNYRQAYDNFDARKIARYNAAKVRRLLKDPGIVRNRLKIRASILNARAFLEIQKEFGRFDRYIWQFTGGQPVQNRRRNQRQVPARTRESDAMSKDLKRRGFKFDWRIPAPVPFGAGAKIRSRRIFVGSTICYAFMQAVGMVNDHTLNCFRHRQLTGKRK